jgi:hypothetical protein
MTIEPGACYEVKFLRVLLNIPAFIDPTTEPMRDLVTDAGKRS